MVARRFWKMAIRSVCDISHWLTRWRMSQMTDCVFSANAIVQGQVAVLTGTAIHMDPYDTSSTFSNCNFSSHSSDDYTIRNTGEVSWTCPIGWCVVA